MKEHLLLEKAYVYPLKEIKNELIGCSYDDMGGFWIINSSKKPYIFDDLSIKPRSKKCDIETGEDKKGE